MQIPTTRIKSTHPKSQGDFVEINAADFDPAKGHELYDGPAPVAVVESVTTPPAVNPFMALAHDWREKGAAELRALAASIEGRMPENVAQAIAMIEAHLAKLFSVGSPPPPPAPEPAPAPVAMPADPHGAAGMPGNTSWADFMANDPAWRERTDLVAIASTIDGRTPENKKQAIALIEAKLSPPPAPEPAPLAPLAPLPPPPAPAAV